MRSQAQPIPGPAALPRAKAADLLELTKPRISSLVLVTVGAGYALAAGTGFSLLGLLRAVVGMALVSGGANALNMLMERDVDGRMRRTQGRPLPAGRLQPLEALLFGAGMVAVGLAWLALLTTPAATLLAAGALVGYLFLYTPLKRRTPLSTWIGAVPGALPPVIGWAAASGTVPAGAWSLFAVLYLWQIPHFMAIAWILRDDYRRAGMPVLSVVDPDGRHIGRQAVRATAGLILASLLPAALGIAGILYAAVAVILGVLFLRPVLRFAHGPSEAGARKVLLGSIAYLPLLLAALTVAGTLLG